MNRIDFHCPYGECKKKFAKPIALVDTTKILRETYYACPHCHRKIDLSIDMQHGNLVSVNTAHAQVDTQPAQCIHHLGYLMTLSKPTSIPDECIACTKAMQCFIKK